MPAQDDTTATPLTVGATFAGYGGLDRAVEAVFGAKVAWVSEYDKDPSMILAHNYPDAPNHGDITKIDWDTIAPVDILTGGYPCFPTGTLILTKDDGWKAIEDVRAGDLVFTHRNRWRPVVRNWGSKQGVTVTITGQGHDGLVATDNHKFPAREKVRTYEGAPRSGRCVLTGEAVKTEAKDLAGKFWSTPTIFPADVVPAVEGLKGVDTNSPAFLWVVGKYLADGDLGALKNDRYYMVRFADPRNGGSDETKQRLTEAGFEFGMNYGTTADRTQVNSVHLATWLDEHFGHGAAEKTLAPWALGLTADQRRGLFDGYIQGDGHAIANGGVRFNSVSKRLAFGMRLLAGTLGYYTSVSKVTPEPTKVIEGRSVNQRPWWRVSCSTSSRTVVIDDGQAWGKVKKVEYTGRTETVWNLEVADDNTYVVEGIIASNCQPFSHAGSRKGTEDKRHLFPFFAKGIEALRPRMVLAENVRGHLSLGFDVVLKEWVRVGYDVQWMTLAASDVGAPHKRARLFIFATDPTQVAPLSAKGAAVAELVNGVWSEPEEHLFGRDAWTGKWPVAGRLVQGVVYDNTAELGDPRAAIMRYLGGEVDVVAASGLLPSPTAALGSGGQTSRSGSRRDELLLAGVAEAVTSGMLPTPRATRGGSGTETMYALGAERCDDERPQGQVLLPTPVASLAGHSAPSVSRSRERQHERGLKLDETVNVIVDDHRLRTAAAEESRSSKVTVLLPTPLGSDARMARNSTAVRSGGLPVPHGGNTLTDLFVPHAGGTALLPTPRASDGEKGGPNQRGSSGDFMLPSAVHHMVDGSSALAVVVEEEPVAKLLPTPVVNDMGRAYTPETWDAWTEKLKSDHGNGNGHGDSLEIEAARLAVAGDDVELPSVRVRALTPPDAGAVADLDLRLPGDSSGSGVPSSALPGYEQWGAYGAAIRRWELITGRPAPAATAEIRSGGPQRLSPAFVEWMMGQPEGWITHPKIGISRNAQLKACGNGVVTLQAEVALRLMLACR